MSNAKLYNNDCLQQMSSFDDYSVDLILTSPPYNMNLRIRNGKHCSRQIVKEISTKYANFDDNLPLEEYEDFNTKVINECLRVSPLVFYNVQFLTGNKSALFSIIGRFSKQLKEIVVWDKVNAQPAIGDGVLNSRFEVILIFSKENAISRQFGNANFIRGTLSNLWQIKRDRCGLYGHGATFPQKLASKVISNFSDKSDVVLDPFMGVGTTGIVCKNLDRRFIGIELDQVYFDIAKRRIENHNVQYTIESCLSGNQEVQL